MKVFLVSVLIMLVGIGSCSHSRNEKPLIGDYDLQGYDYAGKLIFNGAIRFSSLESTEVKGTCKVVKLDNSFEGVVDKDGPCEGRVSGDEITLDLAPTLSDGGLVFDGHWSESRIRGTWRIESLQGGQTFGTFEAAKE